MRFPRPKNSFFALSPRPKKVQLSLLARQTQKILLFLLVFSGGFLGLFFLFLTNQIGMQGYILSVELEKNREISETLERLDSKVARFQAREFLGESEVFEQMVAGKNPEFVFLESEFRAETGVKNRSEF